MKTVRCLATLLLAFCACARADGFFGFEPPGCGSIVTNNMTPKWTWITIYDFMQASHLDYGWVAPFGSRTWRSGHYSCAGIYHVRAEVKSTEGPAVPASDPGNIFDTRVEVKGSDHGVYVKTPIKVQLTDAPPQRWQYDSTTFFLDLNGNLPHVAATNTLPKIVLHNASDLPAVLKVVTSNNTLNSPCLTRGAASPATTADAVNVTVQDCGSQFRFMPYQALPLQPGTNDMYFKTAFELGALKPAFMNTGVTLVNGMGSSIEYVVTTGPSIAPVKTLGQRCVEPGHSEMVSLGAAGSVRVSAYIAQTCGSNSRMPYGPSQVLTVIAGTAQEVGVRGWIDSRP